MNDGKSSGFLILVSPHRRHTRENFLLMQNLFLRLKLIKSVCIISILIRDVLRINRFSRFKVSIIATHSVN